MLYSGVHEVQTQFNVFFFTLKAIDDNVNMNNTPLDPSDSFAWEDPHSQVQQKHILFNSIQFNSVFSYNAFLQ